MYAWYNQTSRYVTFKQYPCGHIPSVGCLRQMSQLALRYHNDEKVCKRWTYNPMLFDMPRWDLAITVPGYATPFKVDTQAFIQMALSSTIVDTVRRNCSQGVTLIGALKRNLFKTRVSPERLKTFFRRLRIAPNYDASKFANTTPSAPLSVQQLSEYTVLMYQIFNAGSSCNARRNLENDLLGNKTVLITPNGAFNITHLYRTPTWATFDNTTISRIGSNNPTDYYLKTYLQGLKVKHRIDLHSLTEKPPRPSKKSHNVQNNITHPTNVLARQGTRSVDAQ